MADYSTRPATSDDIDALVHHRIAMFQDMGITFDAAALDAKFRPWALETMQKGIYRAWVVEKDDAIVAGGGITIIPWPPGPGYLGGTHLAFVYNVYTEPGHRRQGLGRAVMNAIHAWCRAEGISSLALNASTAGQPLYEELGYSVTRSPMMFIALA